MGIIIGALEGQDAVHDVVDEAHAGNPDTIRIVKRAAAIVGRACTG